jgi:hypothetical protein
MIVRKAIIATAPFSAAAPTLVLPRAKRSPLTFSLRPRAPNGRGTAIVKRTSGTIRKCSANVGRTGKMARLTE